MSPLLGATMAPHTGGAEISVSAEERVRRARAAQAEWIARSLPERVRALRRLRRVIADRREQLVEVLVRETGKPPLDALSGDVLVTLEQMRTYERIAPTVLRQRPVRRSRLLFPGAAFHHEYEPFGVALIFGPANYPFQLSMIPAITALYAGNAVILKCSERTPETARFIAGLCAEAQLPEYLMQVVCDNPELASGYIDARPDIIFFTGSSANGRRVSERAGALLIPTVLELGGKDAAIVFSDCNLDRTVEGVAYGAFSHSGQVCVGIKRLYIQREIFPAFLSRLVARTAALRIGDTVDADLGRFEPPHLLRAQVKDALARGARLEYPPDMAIAANLPTILSGVPPGSRLLTEEVFGPVLCVDAFDTESQAIVLANASPFALSASVWTRDITRGRRIASRMNSGSVAVNDVIRNIANPHAAFGGNQASGQGRYHGAEGLRAFSRVKAVMTTQSSRRREINWFPFTRKTYKDLNTLIELRHRPRGIFAALRHLFVLTGMAVLFSSSILAQEPATRHLVLNVTMPSNAGGAVAYLVFASPSGFPQDRSRALRHGFVDAPAAERNVQIDVGALPPGRYAVAVYLDVNNNRKLDSGMFGIPREPVGASNNPRSRFGPPRFNDCAFQMTDADQTLTINLVHPK